jgi:hypothetical protein
MLESGLFLTRFSISWICSRSLESARFSLFANLSDRNGTAQAVRLSTDVSDGSITASCFHLEDWGDEIHQVHERRQRLPVLTIKA